MSKYIISFLSGLIFSFGLTISGMTLPHKVVGFLNVFRQWDVTLVFVMVGAILIHSFSYFFIKKRASPLLDSQFYLPNKKNIDTRLILGALLFGVGWALSGLCPGPAIVSLASFSPSIIVFMLTMTLSSLIAHRVFR